MVAKRINAGNDTPRRPPAATPEARDLELQSLAYDAAEEMLKSGKAPAMLVTHFLKESSLRHKLELKQLEQDTRLKEARIQQIEAGSSQEELLNRAISAFTTYAGRDEDVTYE